MYLEQLKEVNPLTICITNNVVKNFTANGLLALGASPAMSECIEDLEDLLKVADALLINIGTLTKESWQLYQEAIKIANKNQVPVVLDPVAAVASRFRLEVSLDLLKNYSISLLRGNGSEIAALIGEKQASKGADGGKVADLESIAVKANQVFDVPVVVTGETDAIAVRGEVRLLQNGSPLMPLVTGTGCLLGAVLAAFIGSSDRSDDLACLTEAMTVYNVAGEIAEKVAKGKGVGSFQVAFIIDDDIDLVELIDADGLHIGQNDLPVDEARRRLPDKIIGLSVSTMDEYQKSQLSVVDYIGIGPFNPTQSKADAKPAVGNRTTKAVREINQDIPIVAIGGITSDFVHDIIESGADGIAVISAISKANHIVDATRQLRYEVEKALVNRQKHSDVIK